TELADQEHVKGSAQGFRDFIGNRHAASRQPQDNYVWAAGIFTQLGGQEPAGRRTIGKNHGRWPPLYLDLLVRYSFEKYSWLIQCHLTGGASRTTFSDSSPEIRGQSSIFFVCYSFPLYYNPMQFR